MPSHKKQQKSSPPKGRSSDSSTPAPKSASLGTPIDFLVKTMIERDPRKRKVKPVDHKNFESFDLMEDTSSDDSDYQPKNEKEAADDDDDDDNDDDDDEEEEDDDDEDDDMEHSSQQDEDEYQEPPAKKSSATKHKPQNGIKDKKPVIRHPPAVSSLLSSTSSAADLRAASAKFSAIRICAVCCGDQSGDSDEIVECDSCAITVHENCYGVISGSGETDETDSVHSDLSSCSTEPWFCDACKAGVTVIGSTSNSVTTNGPTTTTTTLTDGPSCDLCPNAGGIFKQTESGRWVHVVCALYVTGVVFSDTTHLTGITLSELPVDRWGAKPCSLCEDERFSRTGVTISCDAGLCRTFFHVTCAQREGLLQEVQDMSQEADAVDPFIAHCKLHAADKYLVKSKKRNFLSLVSRMRFKRGSMTSLSSRTLKRLMFARNKYLSSRQMRSKNHVMSPVKKAARMLTTSPAAVRILMRKADLMGYSNLSHCLSHQVTDIRRKWNVAPAFSVEFVSYFLDRDVRISSMHKQLQQLQSQEQVLKHQESEVMKIMTDLVPQYDAMKKTSVEVRDKARTFWSKLQDMAGRMTEESGITKLPSVFESPVKDSHSHRRTSSTPAAHTSATTTNTTPNGHTVVPRRRPGRPPGSGSHSPVKSSLSQELDWKECGSCHKSVDQHLLALCDSCRLHFHLYCLDPPLTRMPKKTRFGGWQCSDCSDRQKRRQKEQMQPEVSASQEDEDEENNESSARKRTRRGPDKYVPDADKFREAAAASAAVAAAASASTPTVSPVVGADGVSPVRKRGRPPMSDKQRRMKLAAKQRELNKKQQKVKVKVEVSLDAEQEVIGLPVTATAAGTPVSSSSPGVKKETPVAGTPVKKPKQVGIGRGRWKREKECSTCHVTSSVKLLAS